MTENSTSSQSLAPLPYNVGNDGAVISSDSTHMLQNAKPVDWNAFLTQSVATMSTNNVFASSNQVMYNPTSSLNISQSPGWASSQPSGGAKKPKRIRTAFTSQQMVLLEQEFARTRYLERARRLELAEALQLNERTIKIWFQNRRMKQKKDQIESMEDSEDTNTSSSLPEIENGQMSMLTHEQCPFMRTDVYNQGNIFEQNYPAVLPPVAMPPTSLPPSMIQNSMQSIPPLVPAQNSVQNMYETFLSREGYRAEYQQGHMYQASHSVIQELPEDNPNEEMASPSFPSENIDNNWDCSWIRSLQY